MTHALLTHVNAHTASLISTIKGRELMSPEEQNQRSQVPTWPAVTPGNVIDSHAPLTGTTGNAMY